MKILVANLGSTSFKYRLFDMADERQLARGGVERIGSPESRCLVQIGDHRQELVAQVPDHAVAVQMCLKQLADPEKWLSERCVGGFGDWFQGGAWRHVQRSAAGERSGLVGDGKNEPRGAGA